MDFFFFVFRAGFRWIPFPSSLSPLQLPKHPQQLGSFPPSKGILRGGGNNEEKRTGGEK